MFGQMKRDASVEATQDVVYGGSKTLPSGIYEAKITKAYQALNKTTSLGLTLELEIDSGSGKHLHTETFWLTNKQQETFYTSKDGKKRELQGFTMANELAQIVTGKEIDTLPAESKSLKIFGEIKQVESVSDLVGNMVYVALKEIRMNKQAKDALGNYVDTNEELIKNEVQKFLALNPHDGQMYTWKEASTEANPEFAGKWLDTHKDKRLDKYKAISGHSASGSGKPKPSTNLQID